MTNPRGPWNINGNGFLGNLWIEGFDAAGNLLPSSTDFGFWDDRSGKLTFMRVIDPADPSTFQIYTGYLMEPQPDAPLAFAGSFEAFAGTGAVAERVLYGWYAIRQ